MSQVLLPGAQNRQCSCPVFQLQGMFSSRTLLLDVPTLLCFSACDLSTLEVVERGTLCQFCSLPPSHSLYPAMSPWLPQRLVRLLPTTENLRTLHDGENSGAELTIGCLVLFGVHMLNGDGGHDLFCEEVGKGFAQVYVTRLRRA